MLDDKLFKIVVNSTPLISIDFIIKKDNKILLGRRLNKPSQNYFFTVGGRINKNETIKNAMSRIAKNELNIELKSTPKFIGVFEHFYDDSVYENVSTHYVNLAYECEVEEVLDLPTEQHDKYQWFTVNQLFESEQVHKYVKDYFKD